MRSNYLIFWDFISVTVFFVGQYEASLKLISHRDNHKNGKLDKLALCNTHQLDNWYYKKCMTRFLTLHLPPPFFSFHHFVFSWCNFPASWSCKMALEKGTRYGDPKTFSLVKMILFETKFIVSSCHWIQCYKNK